MPRHVYLQPDAFDPVFTEERVLALVRRYLPTARRVRAVEESGGEARAYFVDDDTVLKVQRPPQLRPLTSLAKEAFILEWLAALPERDRLAVPRVLGRGRDGPEIEYTLLSRVPGSALRRVDLAPNQRRKVLVELGRSLRRLHELPVDPFVASGLVPGDLSFWDTMTRIAEPLLDRARELRDRGQTWDFPLSIEQIAGRALSSLSPAPERALLHSNPYEEHVFVDASRGIFTGIIDFGDAYVSHPALDLRRWNTLFDRTALLGGYQEAGAAGEAWMGVWRALMIVADVNTMIQSPQAAPAREDLAGLLAELG
jgi:hygromycin-B 7''-O-kinase